MKLVSHSEFNFADRCISKFVILGKSLDRCMIQHRLQPRADRIQRNSPGPVFQQSAQANGSRGSGGSRGPRMAWMYVVERMVFSKTTSVIALDFHTRFLHSTNRAPFLPLFLSPFLLPPSPSPLSSSSPAPPPSTHTPPSRLWRDVPGEELIAGVECQGCFDGLAEIVVAVDAFALAQAIPD